MQTKLNLPLKNDVTKQDVHCRLIPRVTACHFVSEKFLTKLNTYLLAFTCALARVTLQALFEMFHLKHIFINEFLMKTIKHSNEIKKIRYIFSANKLNITFQSVTKWKVKLILV